MSKIKTVTISAILIGVVIQFVPFGKNHTNPQIVKEPRWDTLKTRTLFMHSCADCHSNETKWPWYSHVAPISWLVQHDVDEGREHFNVSNWLHQKKNKGDEAAEEVREGDMPPLVYLPAHPEARLTPTEKRELIKGLINTFGEEN